MSTGASMRLNVYRIAGYVIGLAGFLAIIIAVNLRDHKTTLERATWIPLPDKPLDARDLSVRELLSLARRLQPRGAAISETCGDPYGAAPQEMYSITSAPPFGRPISHIEIVPSDDGIDIIYRDDEVWLSSSIVDDPNTPSASSNTNHEFHFSSQQARPLRNALSRRPIVKSASLGENGTPSVCLDCSIVIMEACIRGRYYVLDDPGDKAMSLLSDLLNDNASASPRR